MEEVAGEVVKEMDYLREREIGLRDTNESTNERVKWFALGTMGLLFALGTWQVIYLRAYFRLVYASATLAVEDLLIRVTGRNILFRHCNEATITLLSIAVWDAVTDRAIARLKRLIGITCPMSIAGTD